MRRVQDEEERGKVVRVCEGAASGTPAIECGNTPALPKMADPRPTRHIVRQALSAPHGSAGILRERSWRLSYVWWLDVLAYRPTHHAHSKLVVLCCVRYNPRSILAVFTSNRNTHRERRREAGVRGSGGEKRSGGLWGVRASGHWSFPIRQVTRRRSDLRDLSSLLALF